MQAVIRRLYFLPAMALALLLLYYPADILSLLLGASVGLTISLALYVHAYQVRLRHLGALVLIFCVCASMYVYTNTLAVSPAYLSEIPLQDGSATVKGTTNILGIAAAACLQILCCLPRIQELEYMRCIHVRPWQWSACFLLALYVSFISVYHPAFMLPLWSFGYIILPQYTWLFLMFIAFSCFVLKNSVGFSAQGTLALFGYQAMLFALLCVRINYVVSTGYMPGRALSFKFVLFSVVYGLIVCTYLFLAHVWGLPGKAAAYPRLSSYKVKIKSYFDNAYARRILRKHNLNESLLESLLELLARRNKLCREQDECDCNCAAQVPSQLLQKLNIEPKQLFRLGFREAYRRAQSHRLPARDLPLVTLVVLGLCCFLLSDTYQLALFTEAKEAYLAATYVKTGLFIIGIGLVAVRARISWIYAALTGYLSSWITSPKILLSFGFGWKAFLLAASICTAICICLLYTSRQAERAVVFAKNDKLKNCLIKDYGITDEELEVVLLLGRGRSAAHVADDLCVSPYTVAKHRKHIYQKLHIHSQIELMILLM